MAISGNAANRDQTNTAVTQENKGNHQVIVWSQSDSYDVNVVNSNSTTLNNSNTTVTNTDKSVHNVSVANDYSNKSQQTVNNHYQEVQNVYRIEQRVERQAPASQPNSLPNMGYANAMNAVGNSPAPSAPSTPTVNTNQIITTNNNRISMEMVREMIKNAKATSDMAYDMALRLTQ